MKVEASFSQTVDSKTRIMYIPEGVHGISPSVDGKPGSIVSKVSAERGEAIVEALNKSLNKRLSKNVRPIVDFDHKDTGPAAAIPSKFSYEKGVGVMLDVEWTASGTSAIEGKDYSYFSPVYNMNRNTGEPSGLPSSGPVGALVNDPAFREIRRIAASNQSQSQPTEIVMDKTALIKAGLITEAESKTDQVDAIAASNLATIQAKAAKVDGLEAEVVKLKASLTKGAEVTADRLIEDAVKTLRVAAKDESTKEFWRDQLIEASHDSEKFDKVSAALSAIKPTGGEVLNQVVTVKAGESQTGDKDARQKQALVKASQALGKDAPFSERWDYANKEDEAAFQD